MSHHLRVLIVDDTVTYRKIVSDVLAEIPYVEVVGSAANGKIALEKVAQLHPDLLLLDVEMPELDGVQVLRRLPSTASETGAIMLSAFTAQGAQTTMTCLGLGAFDFVLKPSGQSMDENFDRLRRELKPRLAAYARKRELRAILAGHGTPPNHAEVLPTADTVDVRPSAMPPRVPVVPEVVAIGISTGGPKALTEMLPRLPEALPVPVLIVQHMPPVFTQSLAEDLDRRCALNVREAQDGMDVQAGQILIAPGGKQMKVCREGGCVAARITDDPPENSCRPSVDYLFRSVAAVYGGKTLAVIMTGMGNDGSAGCRLIKRLGGAIAAQDEGSCVVFGMPRQPVEEGLADVVAPLDRLAAEIVRMVGGGRLVCRYPRRISGLSPGLSTSCAAWSWTTARPI